MTIRQRIYFVFLSAAAASLLLYGCSSSQNLSLSGDGSGKARIGITLSPMVIRYAEDIAGGFSGDSGAASLRLFDKDKIQLKLSSLKGVHSVKVEDEEQNKLELSFSFDSIEDLLPGDDSAPPVFLFRNKNGVKTLSFTLTAGNFSSVTDFLGLENNEVLDTFGPQKDDPFSDEEYTEMAEYLFDEYASKKAIDSVLEKSSVDVNISVDGRLVSIDSTSPVSSSFSGSGGSVRIPLLTVLTLSEPVKITVVWK